MKRLPKTHMGSCKSRAQPGSSAAPGLRTSPWQEGPGGRGNGEARALALLFGTGSCSPEAGLPATPWAHAGSASVGNHSPPHPCPRVPQALLRVGEKPARCQVQKESSGRGGGLQIKRTPPSEQRSGAALAEKLPRCVNPATAPLGHLRQPFSPSSILEAPCLSLGSKTGAGVGRQGVSWATCEADCRSQDLQLEPDFFPPPRHPYTLLRSPLQHHSCISFHLRRGKEAAALAGARCCWKSGPQPGAPGPSPAPLAAGEHRVLGVKPSAASQPQPSHHQLGQGTFPRLLLLFQQGQGCPCPPVALRLV